MPARRGTGLGTVVGILLSAAVLVAAALQLTGVYDVSGALGLRADPTAEQSATRTERPGDDGQAVANNAETAAAPAAEQGTAADSTLTPTQRATQIMGEMRQGNHPHAHRIAALRQQARDAARDGRIEDAINLVDNAIQLDRTNADLFCLSADLRREAGNYDEADALREECFRLQDVQGRAAGTVTEP